jgi:hypothetical protein
VLPITSSDNPHISRAVSREGCGGRQKPLRLLGIQIGVGARTKHPELPGVVLGLCHGRRLRAGGYTRDRNLVSKSSPRDKRRQPEFKTRGDSTTYFVGRVGLAGRVTQGQVRLSKIVEADEGHGVFGTPSGRLHRHQDVDLSVVPVAHEVDKRDLCAHEILVAPPAVEEYAKGVGRRNIHLGEGSLRRHEVEGERDRSEACAPEASP